MATYRINIYGPAMDSHSKVAHLQLENVNYPYQQGVITFLADDPIGTRGGLFIQDYNKVTWFSDLGDALKHLGSIVACRNFGAAAVYAVTLANAEE